MYISLTTYLSFHNHRMLVDATSNKENPLTPNASFSLYGSSDIELFEPPECNNTNQGIPNPLPDANLVSLPSPPTRQNSMKNLFYLYASHLAETGTHHGHLWNSASTRSLGLSYMKNRPPHFPYHCCTLQRATSASPNLRNIVAKPETSFPSNPIATQAALISKSEHKNNTYRRPISSIQKTLLQRCKSTRQAFRTASDTDKF